MKMFKKINGITVYLLFVSALITAPILGLSQQQASPPLLWEREYAEQYSGVIYQPNILLEQDENTIVITSWLNSDPDYSTYRLERLDQSGNTISRYDTSRSRSGMSYYYFHYARISENNDVELFGTRQDYVTGPRRLFIAKYSSNGDNLADVYSMSPEDGIKEPYHTETFPHSNGKVYVLGGYISKPESKVMNRVHGFVCYEHSGKLLWSKRLDSVTNRTLSMCTLLENRVGNMVFASNIYLPLDTALERVTRAYYLSEVDTNGITLKSKLFYGEEMDRRVRLSKLIECRDGGYAATGWQFPFYDPNAFPALYFARFDDDLNLLFDTTYVYGSTSEGNDIVECKDGGFFITGFTQYQNRKNDLDSQIYCIKISATGEKIFEYDWGPDTTDDVGMLGIESSDGNYVIAGTIKDSLFFENPDAAMYLAKISGTPSKVLSQRQPEQRELVIRQDHSSERVSIESSDGTPMTAASLHLYDISGKRIPLRGITTHSSSSLSFDTSTLATGSYRIESQQRMAQFVVIR